MQICYNGSDCQHTRGGTHPMTTHDQPLRDSADALHELLEGNARYVAAQMTHPDQTPERRTEVATGQHPLAAIFSCSDSRVPPEVVFDQGLGDLFVVRVAG